MTKIKLFGREVLVMTKKDYQDLMADIIWLYAQASGYAEFTEFELPLCVENKKMRDGYTVIAKEEQKRVKETFDKIMGRLDG